MGLNLVTQDGFLTFGISSIKVVLIDASSLPEYLKLRIT
jgi:hypothetical protein